MNPLKNKIIPPNSNAYTSSIVHTLPKSLHYRDALENLIGMEVILEGAFHSNAVRLIPDFGTVDFVCFTKLKVKQGCTPVGNADKKSVIDHIWVICDSDYTARNNLKTGELFRLKGSLYEYTRDGTDKNIGMILKKAERVNKTPEELLHIKNLSKNANKEIAAIQYIVQQKKTQEQRKVTGKKLEMQILQCLENFCEEQDIREFCDLSSQVRMTSPEWYPVLVKNANYLARFIESNARKHYDDEESAAFIRKYKNAGKELISAAKGASANNSTAPAGMPMLSALKEEAAVSAAPVPSATESRRVSTSSTLPVGFSRRVPESLAPPTNSSRIVFMNGRRINLDVAGEELAYRKKLQGVVNTFMNEKVTCKRPQQQTYVIADCEKLICVMSPSKMPVNIKGAGEDLKGRYKFIDVCYFIGSDFHYMHYGV